MSDRRLTQQRIAELLALLDRSDNGVPSIHSDPELVALADLGRGLKATAGSAPADPGFRTGLRASLLTAAAAGNLEQAARQRRASVLETATLDTDIGPLLALYSGRTLHLLTTATAEGEERVRRMAFQRFRRDFVPAAKAPAWLERRVAAALHGHRPATPPDLSALPDFPRRVLETVQGIVPGEVRSYDWVARQIGSPGAARAVGNALKNNPYPLLIPCHRVIHADGDSGAYALGGAGVKQRLLEQEGVNLQRLKDLSKQGMVVQGNRNTKIFCLFACRSAKWSTGKHTRPLPSIEAAYALGYRPCKICRPA